jgi:GT2 family glycosyltransferase
MKNIAVLLTVHNRKEETLLCLGHLFAQKLTVNYQMDVYMTDDGCTDGTSEAVKTKFPKVNIVQGNGNLYWNRGMILAWETAAKIKNYDFYLWLNDDTIIYPNAINQSLKASEIYQNKSIICGSTESNNICTYSAYKKIKGHKFIKLEPNGILQPCEVFNGNFVLIPDHVYKKVGTLDPIFCHNVGDFDYGLRANKKSINAFLLEEFIGICEHGNNYRKYENPNLSLIKRLKILYSPLGNNPIKYSIYQFRHFGITESIKHFFWLHFKTINTLKK